MSELNPAKDVLFVGLGQSAVAWYRCFLPAIFMGADWCGLYGDPPNLGFATGMIQRKTQPPNFYDYKVIVLQQPSGTRWLAAIRKFQERGIKVLYEVDDYLHGIRKKEDHDFAKNFDKKALKQIELCMRVCDGLIVSTDYLYRRYRAFNKRVYVCENGIDTARYRLTPPPRPSVNIGWAGATGHGKALIPWLQSVLNVMNAKEETCFVTIGQPYAKGFEPQFGARAITVPFTLIEQYPSAMTMMDIALAPAGKGSWYRGKSDLRWLEAGALGVPLIGDPDCYPKINHGVDGFHAATPKEVEELLLLLVEDPDLRHRVGQAAKVYVHENRDIRVTAKQWSDVFAEVVD